MSDALDPILFNPILWTGLTGELDGGLSSTQDGGLDPGILFWSILETPILGAGNDSSASSVSGGSSSGGRGRRRRSRSITGNRMDKSRTAVWTPAVGHQQLLCFPGALSMLGGESDEVVRLSKGRVNAVYIDTDSNDEILVSIFDFANDLGKELGVPRGTLQTPSLAPDGSFENSGTFFEACLSNATQFTGEISNARKVAEYLIPADDIGEKTLIVTGGALCPAGMIVEVLDSSGFAANTRVTVDYIPTSLGGARTGAYAHRGTAYIRG